MDETSLVILLFFLSIFVFDAVRIFIGEGSSPRPPR